MSSVNLQFYATQKELQELVRGIRDEGPFFAALIRIAPGYEFCDITHCEQIDLAGWRFVIFSREALWLDTHEAYCVYRKKKRGNLEILLGQETEFQIVESAIGAAAENSIDPLWKKAIERFRGTLCKGGYVVTPQNVRRAYPNIRYTVGAQMAYRKGKKLLPLAGWNHFEL